MPRDRRWSNSAAPSTATIDLTSPLSRPHFPARLPWAWLIALLVATPGLAQTAPGNVVAPPPPPREGTVGPEQLRDFALPGTRQPEAEAPTPAPTPPATRPAPSASTPPTSTTAAPGSAPAADPIPAARSEMPATRTEPQAPLAPSIAIPDFATDSAAIPVPLPPAPQPNVVPEQPALRWWPWLLAAALGAGGFGLWWRRGTRRGYGAGTSHAFAGEPPAAPDVSTPRVPPPAPPKALEPALPAGLVTTRLRQTRPVPSPTPPSIVSPPPPAGAVVSTRLRPRLELELAVSEVLLSADEILFRFRLSLANRGTAPARDIAIEALGLNAGEQQAAELGTFYARPTPDEAAIAALAPMAAQPIDHEVRMPRLMVREYEAGGRRLFVPLIAFNTSYRWSGGEGRTSAAFLVGHAQRGSDRLAPLRLDTGAQRLQGLAVRMLDEQQRR